MLSKGNIFCNIYNTLIFSFAVVACRHSWVIIVLFWEDFNVTFELRCITFNAKLQWKAMFLYAEYFSLMAAFTEKLASFWQGSAMLLLDWKYFYVKLMKAVSFYYLVAVGLGFLYLNYNFVPTSLSNIQEYLFSSDFSPKE